MRSASFDLRDGLRSFRHDRAYAVTIIFTLALTIGATTAVFSIVNGVLLAPLAYDGSDQLVALRERWREAGDLPFNVNDRHANYWREHARSFDSMAQYIVRTANLTGRGEAMQVNIARANATLFDVLRTGAAIGRTLTLADEPEGAPDVIALTDTSWRHDSAPIRASWARRSSSTENRTPSSACCPRPLHYRISGRTSRSTVSSRCGQ